MAVFFSFFLQESGSDWQSWGLNYNNDGDPNQNYHLLEVSDLDPIVDSLNQLSNSTTDFSNAISTLSIGLNNEAQARSEADNILVQITEIISKRIDNLLYDPIPETSVLNGFRKYLNEFAEIFSVDQVDGLTQRFQFFTNALSGKLSDISASIGTGISIDKSNPAFPIITQNNPTWNNVTGKPSLFPPVSHTHVLSEITGLITALGNKLDLAMRGSLNGVASLNAEGKIPASQLPVFDPALTIVENIAERNNLTPTTNLPCYVKNATDDVTVNTGGAFYLYDASLEQWIKLSEMESMDIIQDWDNIINKPATFPATTHTHNFNEINNNALVSNLNGSLELNLSVNSIFILSITGNSTITIINPILGFTYVFIFKITANGFSLNLPAGFLFNDPLDGIQMTNGNTAILTAIYIGSNQFLASIKQEYVT